ncbi:MAG: class V aminotransferase [Bdellovibrionales bacterium GWB1_55_8]|nr:MAG: class V aminotransferase [Bdellovibrionales bacterium GWB1_55_8]
MKKTYLLAPGPTPIPESVTAALSGPLIHHRTPAFQAILDDVRAGLRHIFQTRQDVLLLSTSGTGGMEAALTNLFSPSDEVIYINAGKFGERWGKIAKAYGLTPIEVKVPNGETLEIRQLEEKIKQHPAVKAVLFQASETSTGVKLPTQEICKVTKAANILSVCDAITACGVFDLPMDEWGIDVLITGSQKALMIPPGLAMIALSEKAWAAVEKATLPRFYFDLLREKKAAAKSTTAWTPPISLIQGLQESLRMIKEEGLHNVFKRHELLARATRAGVQALGLEIFARKPSPALTAVKVPSGIKDGKLIPKTMRDKYGVTIAGGQDELEGKIFRLSHFGYADRFDVTTALSALELTLHDLGHPVEFGKGVGAALRTFSEG